MQLRVGLLLLVLLFLLGCGSGSNNDGTELPADGESPSSGILQPQPAQDLTGNLTIQVNVTDDAGIKRVSLAFNQLPERYVLCETAQQCGGNRFAATVGNINPISFGVTSGPLELTLFVLNNNDVESAESTITIDWTLSVIDAVSFSRSSDGSELTLQWTEVANALRYNVYLATEPGVNQSTYSSLPQGQAYLALTSTSLTAPDLLGSAIYYAQITAVTGSGESAFSEEIIIAAGNVSNAAPVANDDTVVTNEDTGVEISALDNDSDVDGDPITIVSVTAPAGQATINGSVIDFIPLANFFGATTLEYTIADPSGAQDSAQISVDVIAVNDAPVVNNETASVVSGNAVNIDVLANDSDVDGDVLSLTSAAAGNGGVVIESNNTLTYTAPAGFAGRDTLDYDVTDGSVTVSGQVEIAVSTTNLPPVAVDDQYDVVQNTLLQIAPSSGLLINDSDPNNDALSVITVPVTTPSLGTLTLAADGSFTYNPNTGVTGTDSIDYQIEDATGLTSIATLSIDIQPLPGNLLGDSTQFNGEFLYIGLGETSPGSGVGTGRYRIGDCQQIVDTLCTMTGLYTEAGGSGNQPGASGRFVYTMSYGGTGDSPVIAKSNSAGSSSVVFTALGDAKFELYLYPDAGGEIRAYFPDPAFATLTNFSAFIATGQVCQGLPVGTPCSIGNVGLYPGATDTAPLDRLSFDLSGYATVDINNEPVASNDSYITGTNQTLTVSAPGVLNNDNDADVAVVGDTLVIPQQFATAMSEPVSLAADGLRQRIYAYSGFANDIEVYSRSGQILTTFSWPGVGANDADLDVVAHSFNLNSQPVPQGSLLAFNGESGPAVVYALDPQTGAILAQLNTGFGVSHVVGGAYNPITDSLFLLQDNVPGGTDGNLIAEVDPDTGQVLSQFSLNSTQPSFNVSFGDLDVHPLTGNLYVVSSIENHIAEYTPTGRWIRDLQLPVALNNVSGIAIGENADRLWLVNTSSTSPIYELGFANSGELATLVTLQVVTPPNNGVLTLNPDGSFVYLPDTDFVGTDSFTYEVSDQIGKTAQGQVTIEVQ